MKRKKILSTEGFFRKSTFCTLMDLNPGHVMNIFIKWNFHSASNKAIYVPPKKIKIDAVVQKYHVVAQYCQIFKVAPIHGIDFFFKARISSVVKVPFSKNIDDMTQCLPNPGFRSIKVQNMDFLKKPSVDNIFFSSLMLS